MASIQPRGDKFQLRVKHKLLPKPYFSTFDTEVEARTYGDQLDSLLARGIVPQEMLAATPKGHDPLIIEVARQYAALGSITDSDNELLTVVLCEIPGLRVSGVTFGWVEGYVRRLKIESNLAPGTIRKRIGLLGRVLDWHWLRLAETTDDGRVPANPLRLMPVGYSQYSKAEALTLQKADKAGKVAKVDIKRDRRFPADDEARVRCALAGAKRADRERALSVDPEFTLLFDTILDTGMRLSEAYRLRVDQFDFARGIVHVEGSKGHRGVLKPRTVPLKKELREKLRAWCEGKSGLLFSFWDGTPEGRNKASSKLSVRFGSTFAFAGVADMTEHDLRHEACCRWVELRRPNGVWIFSDIEICKIMGWTDTRMMLNYASLRGEDLADRLL